MCREEGAKELQKTKARRERLRGQCGETAVEDRRRRLNQDSRNGSVDKALAEQVEEPEFRAQNPQRARVRNPTPVILMFLQ